MSQWDKLLSRLTTLDERLRFEGLKKILEAYGYRINDSRSGGSHYVFRKEGKRPITVPRHGKIKRVYIKMVCDVVEEEEREDG